MTAMLALLCAAAFGRDTTPDAPLSIVSGQNESGYPSAVAIGFEASGFRQSTCTASLITPTMLLTAGHCIEELPYPEELLLEYGAAFLGEQVQDARMVPFKSIQVHPGYTSISGFTGTPENDYAVVELEAPVRNVTPVWFNTDPLDDEAIGTRLVSVGYGVTDGLTQTGSGRKRSARIKVADVDGQFLVSLTDENPGEGNLCSGDSGGPQYYEDEEGHLTQWAVHSWADQYCRVMSGSSRTDAVGDWILKQVDRVHGTTDACALTLRYGDGVCDEGCDNVDPDCLSTVGGGTGLAGGGDGEGRGCSHTGGLNGAWGALALLALRRRR